jgi:hypothetical protein
MHIADGSLTHGVTTSMLLPPSKHVACVNIIYRMDTIPPCLTLIWYHVVYVTPFLFDSLFLKLSRIMKSPFTYFFLGLPNDVTHIRYFFLFFSVYFIFMFISAWDQIDVI